MPVKVTPAVPASESADQFAAEITPQWPMATHVTVSVVRQTGREEPAMSFEVTHVEGMDPARACLTDLRDVWAQCREHAITAGKPAYYVIRVIGSVPKSRRHAAQTNTELHRTRQRFGEEVAADNASESASVINQLATFVKSIPVAYSGLSSGYEQFLAIASKGQDLILQQMAAVAAENAALREQVGRGSAFLAEMHRTTLEYEAAERREQRAHEAAAGDRAMKREWVSGITELIRTAVSFHMASRGGTGGHAGTAKATDAQPSPGSIAYELSALLKELDDTTSSKLEAIMGDRIWDLLHAAASKTDDAEARAVLQALVRELNENKAAFATKLNEAATLLTEQQLQRLLAIFAMVGG